jgi:hypothetical protein
MELTSSLTHIHLSLFFWFLDTDDLNNRRISTRPQKRHCTITRFWMELSLFFECTAIGKRIFIQTLARFHIHLFAFIFVSEPLIVLIEYILLDWHFISDCGEWQIVGNRCSWEWIDRSVHSMSSLCRCSWFM